MLADDLSSYVVETINECISRIIDYIRALAWNKSNGNLLSELGWSHYVLQGIV